MAELPDEFPCRLLTWEYIYDRSRAVADAVKRDEYDPDAIIALARGGWFAGRCLCDFLGIDDLASLKIEHYVGTAETAEEPVVRYPLPDGSVDGKNILVVDDIADTGQSLEQALENVTARDPSTVRTATLQLLATSEYEPTYIGERLDTWAWIVYPWNFIEDMIDLIHGVMEKDASGPYSETDIRRLLEEYHDIDRIAMEVAQPDRLPEVLREMDRRGVITQGSDETWILTDE